MLAYALKDILELVPEVQPLVKQASIEDSYPLNNADSCIASALEWKYHQFVDHKPVDPFVIEKVAKAVDLYGVTDKVTEFTDKLVKAAELRNELKLKAKVRKETCMSKQASFDGNLTGFVDLVSVSEQASELYKEANELGIEPSEPVLRYSGHAFLDKKAAVESLAARFHLTNDVNFVKIASALGRMDTTSLKPESIYDVCKTVSMMDKEAGISAKGFDFFREALITKEAAIASAMNVKLCGKDVPYENIERVGRARISKYIGEDVAKELDMGPAHSKQVLETLPADLQQILCNLIANI